jgi:hypothetical protein
VQFRVEKMILEKMYSIPALAFFSVLFVGWYVTSTLAYRSKLAKLGAKPRQVPYHLPFGIDVLIEGIQVQSPDFGASDSVQSCPSYSKVCYHCIQRYLLSLMIAQSPTRQFRLSKEERRESQMLYISGTTWTIYPRTGITVAPCPRSNPNNDP